ncbi:MAG: transglutaminase domain-containing protein [Chloroflexota bacterium]
MLRETAVTNIPPAILARYTALPGSVPQRVHDLAQEIAGEQANPYDQARAIEQFLRQYTYSLAVDSPPRSADPVDYFLFEQQAGYCDFYASAMVVLARSVGLPARLAIGYLAQPPDASGGQTIYQINGHSWAEVYFAGFGWVEFEPTAAFRSPHTNPATLNQPPDFAPQAAELAEPELPPVPEAAPERPFPWLLWLGIGVAGGIFWLWRRSQLPAGADAVLWSYGRFQQQAAKLGQAPHPSQTPQEFLTTFEQFLAGYGRFPRLARWLAPLRPHLARLTALYVRRRYAGDTESGRLQAWESWRWVKRPLWLLRIVRLLANQKQ